MAKQVYNRVYSAQKWEQVNSFNKGALDDYIQECKAQGKTPATVKQYYNDGRIILIYILEKLRNKELHRLRKKDFRNFTLYLQDNGMSASRINRLLVTARTFLNFCMEDDEYMDDFEDCKLNPSRIKGTKKEKRREIVFLEDAEIQVIYGYLIDHKRYSEALLCAIMYDGAIRRKEAFQIKRYDISLDSNICKETIRGKGGKQYRPLYNDMSKEAYKLLEESRNDNSDSLWLTKQGTPASYETLYNQVISWRKILEKEYGVKKDFNPHSFRHSALENLKRGTHYIAVKLNKRFELTELQKLANHSDISTTQGYLKEDDEEVLLEAFGI